VLREHAGAGFGKFKTALTDLLVEKLSPIAAETTRLLADEGELIRILSSGAERAAAISEPIVTEVEKIVGFLGLH
jgi:tryptophanyl-tRNA synthetase